MPTDSALVTSTTELADLNLNWSESDLPESQRTKHVHRLHPYLGKYIPQLAEVFLRKYFKPGDTVVDPFVGSGTTLVQASELGINAVGYDITGLRNSAFFESVFIWRKRCKRLPGLQYRVARPKGERGAEPKSPAENGLQTEPSTMSYRVPPVLL